MTSINDILNERGSKYGPFPNHATITQNLKEAMQATHGWERLDAHHKEALEMIAHKIGRILNGDPDYDDSWVDIAGYAQLVVDEIRRKHPGGAGGSSSMSMPYRVGPGGTVHIVEASKANEAFNPAKP